MRKRPLRNAQRFFVEWVILTGIWFLFVGRLGTDEWILGLGAVVTSLVAVILVQQEPIAYFSPYLKWFIQGWRLPYYMVTGTVEILRALSKQIFTRQGAPSCLRAADFDPGGETGGSQARRAIAVTYTTSTPNFVILGIDRKNRLLLFHQVFPGPVLKMTKNLGAHP